MKDEKKHHGAVDKPSLEQQNHTPSASGSGGRLVGRQSDEMLVDFKNVKILYRLITLLGFS